MEDFSTRFDAYRRRAEAALDDWLPAASASPRQLHEAMRYSLEAGGKRLRPVLVLATFDLAPSSHDPAPAAAAVEALHTYSLIHDDLPCMDNSALRRGKPTCHKAFDEATALLAGDALLTEAFGLLARAYADDPALAVAVISDLAKAAGSRKLIGGQMEDLLSPQFPPNAERLDTIHRHKTAALLGACTTIGARLSQLGPDKLACAEAFGKTLGMAFQILDDILDATAESATTGKTTGLDVCNDTLTYPRLHGLEAARVQAAHYTQKAAAYAREWGGERADFLVALVLSLEKRLH